MSNLLRVATIDGSMLLQRKWFIALDAYAVANGRTWKNSLKLDWMNARYPSCEEFAAELQSMRNAGLSLQRFNLKKAREHYVVGGA